MSGQGSGSGPTPQPQTPWSGVSQQAGTNTVQATPGSAAPPIPGITPGTAPQAPYRGPMSPLSGFSPTRPDMGVNPLGMSNGMPQVNAQTGTGNYIGAPSFLTSPPPVQNGYGLGPQPGQQQPGAGWMPPTIGTGR